MQSSTAREAACASDSENFHELDSENVNAARVNFSMQMCFATYEYNCQRRWSKIVLHSFLHLNRQPHQRWRLKRNPPKKMRTWKAKRTKKGKRKKVAVGEAAARENLETSGTQFAKIAHQLFSHLLEFKVCFPERRSSHIREGRNTTSFAKKPIQSFLNGWDDLTSTKRSFFNGWDDCPYFF